MHIVFEGPDGSGKSTLAWAVGTALAAELAADEAHRLSSIVGYRAFAGEPPPSLPPLVAQVQTAGVWKHPGATRLGHRLRQLLMTEAGDIDGFSRQVLHMVDAIHFYKSVLEPGLASGKTFLNDRCTHISSLVYGMASGASLVELTKLSQLYAPPSIDLLFVLCCPLDICRARNQERDANKPQDHYEGQGLVFHQKVHELYSLLAGYGTKTEPFTILDGIVKRVIPISSAVPAAMLVRPVFQIWNEVLDQTKP